MTCRPSKPPYFLRWIEPEGARHFREWRGTRQHGWLVADFRVARYPANAPEAHFPLILAAFGKLTVCSLTHNGLEIGPGSILHQPEVAVGVIGRRFGLKLDEESRSLLC